MLPRPDTILASNLNFSIFLAGGLVVRETVEKSSGIRYPSDIQLAEQRDGIGALPPRSAVERGDTQGPDRSGPTPAVAHQSQKRGALVSRTLDASKGGCCRLACSPGPLERSGAAEDGPGKQGRCYFLATAATLLAKMNDEQLIREYCLQGSQEAFAELVRRYAGLVYGTARRHAGDAFAAEEICQEVFCALARQIASIRKPGQLSSWLYGTARRLGAMHVRGDQRRVAREKAATLMNSNDMDAGPSWESVEPLLDEALENLGEEDRAAILGRFFRGMSMAEVGEGLGVSEAAAKMRVGRAVEKLRTFFAQHGAACSAAALLLLLERNAAAQPSASVIGSVLSHVARSGIRWPDAASVSKTGPYSRAVLPVAVGVVLLGLIWIGYDRAFPARRAAQALLAEGAKGTQDPAPVPRPTNALQALPSGNGLRLRVLDANSSAPLAGVKVTATLIQLRGAPLGEAVTDAGGRCEVPRPAPAPGDFFYTVRAEHEGYVTMMASWSRYQMDEPTDIPDYFELKMPPGTRIGGFLTDEEGRPLPGIQVKLQGAVFQPGPPPRQRPRLNSGGSETTSTGRDGLWAWDRMPPDWESIRIIFAGQEFPPATYVCDANRHPFIGQRPLVREDLLTGRAHVQLQRGLPVTGRVLDPNRRPLPGVRVVQNYNWSDDYASVVTGNDGAYRILNASTGHLALCFQAEHYAPQTVELAVSGPTTAAPVTLTAGHLLRGRVTDDAGNPLEGVAISAGRAGPGRSEFEWRTKSDAAGSFSWDGAPDGPLGLFSFKPGFRLMTSTVTVDGPENIITLERAQETGIRVHGEVCEDSGGAPIRAFEILLSEGPQGNPAVSKEGRDGKFTVRLDKPSDPSGGASIAIRAEGYEPAASQPVPATNGDCTLTFRLRRSNGWNGVVLLPDGQPAASAEVALSSHLGGPILGRRQLLYRDQCVFRLTGEDGRFHFDSLDAVSPQRGVLPGQRQYGHDQARLIVAVHPQGYAERAPEKLDQSPVLRLEPWGRIEGLLRSSRGPVAQREVSILKRSCLPWVNSVLLSPTVFMTATDADGRFVFDDVPPGEHALGCHFPGASLETRLTVQVKAGETARVELGGNGANLTGKLSVPEIQSGFDFSHSNGHLQRVQAKPADLPRTVRRIDFASDEAYQQAEKSEGTRIIAWWQSPEGLAAWREARNYALWFDADGTLHAEDVPAGEYDVTVLLQEPGERVGERRPVGHFIYKAKVVVPESANSKSGEPVDLGTIDLDK